MDTHPAAKYRYGNGTGGEHVTVRLRWFGVLAERRGKRDETVTIPPGSTADDLVDLLASELPDLGRYRKHIRVAVNRAYAEPDRLLEPDDEIAFITPVSGG